MCNCLTLNVDSVNSELTISGTLNGKNTYSYGTYTVSWNGSRWEVYEEVTGCDVISVTYTLVGEEPVTVEVESSGTLNGKNRFDFLTPNATTIKWDTGVGKWVVTRSGVGGFQATLSEDTECPFGTYTIEEGSIFEAFEVNHAQTLIGTNTNNTVCPLGIFTPITVTNVNITECFNENDIQPLIQLTEQLYPTGRGFNIHIGSFIRKMHLALNRSESRLNDNTLDILNGILPDNDSFTVEDATLWEQRLGLITNDAVSLANRKLAIIRKLNYPGTIIARQSGGFIESQLRLAGFDVYVHENPDLISIEELLNELNNVANLGLGNIGGFNLGSVFSVYPNLFTDSNIGGFNLGEVNLAQIDFKGKVVNNITDSLDLHFNIGNSRIKTFFVGGENLGDFADVPTARKDEFRQLILKLKPTETVAYLLINYT
jgi:hypothetical protein